jgi:DNA recombination protein RmuC
VTGDDAMWTIALSLGVGACIGGMLGALAALLWRARRESALRVEVETLRAHLRTDEVVQAEREQSLELARFQLQGTFGELARESLVQPIREALAKTETQIRNIERDRIDAFATLRSQMEILATGQTLLSRETRNLVTALRRPDVRGQWGEITLKRLVELSGMTAHVDFTEQHHQTTESGAIRPDMIVHMPERRDIVVDVKTPLDAYLAAVEARDDEERSVQLRRHAQIVGARVRDLSSKQYWSQFEDSPEFVVLFLPGDQFLTAALQENHNLIEEALRQNVMLATPTSLVALLKAVAHGWKQAVLADNAAEIRRLGEDLYKRLAVFGEHLGRLGKSLGSSVDSFNKAVGSLEQQILPAARRFPELGLRVQRDLEVLEPVDTLARTPRAAGQTTDETRSENT